MLVSVSLLIVKLNRKEKIMKSKDRKEIISGAICLVAFAIWTLLIQIIDVKAVGVNGTEIGFSAFNTWFHSVTGVSMALYTITDWAGLVPIFICMLFGAVGFVQLVKRKSLFKVDFDIVALGIYYIIVIAGYLAFEMVPINYRPILINGFMEASYPSSTTLLVLCVMPTLVFEVNKRIKGIALKGIINIITVIFTICMVLGRLLSGVHWVTDIVGSVLLSCGLFNIYKGIVLWNLEKNCRN